MSPNKKKPQVDYLQCMACTICISCCPFSCLEASRCDIDSYGKAYPELVRKADCTGCGLCASECPFDAITMAADL